MPIPEGLRHAATAMVVGFAHGYRYGGHETYTTTAGRAVVLRWLLQRLVDGMLL